MPILIVDDDPECRAQLRRALEELGDGWELRFAATAKEGLALAAAPDVECVLLDYRLPDADGVACLADLRRMRPELPVVMVTGTGSEGVAVNAMKLGAADYVVKDGLYAQMVPGIVRELLGRKTLARAAKDAAVLHDAPVVDPAARARFEAEGFVVRSPAMLHVLHLVARAAESNVGVLIEGESGTGKDLCARAIHGHGPRAARPFLTHNCAAVPETLLESELFGHARGAFTGADRAHVGLFEQADGGTLFLDEIGELSPTMQAKLLRVLENREVRPVGGTAAREVDVRIVAATNRDLRADVQAGRFRLDLLHRVRVFPIAVPPLRERRDDVASLAEHFLARFAREERRPVTAFAPETMALMERYAWPGNVRELQNEVRRLVLCVEPEEPIPPEALQAAMLEDSTTLAETSAPLEAIHRQVEAAVIKARLLRHGFRREATAESLGISRESLWRKLRALGLRWDGKK